VQHLTTDHLGSVRVISDQTGAPVQRFDYQPYGEDLYENTQTGPKFTGKPQDAVGLYHYGARFYDPELGRFITMDPAKDGLNWWAYCSGNPLKYVDPDGYSFVPPQLAGMIGGAIAGGIYQAYRTYVDEGQINWRSVADGVAYGALAGVALYELCSLVKAAPTPVLYPATQGTSKAATELRVIGHYPEYVQLANKLDAKVFSIPQEVWSKMSPAEQWAANQKFLDRAIAKGAEFILATPIDQVRSGSFLEKEIAYLLSQGYRLIESGTKLVK
jgi:RHS repeat-associated protein